MRLATGTEVRARIADLILGNAPETVVGAISLKKHQGSAVQRVGSAIAEFGGALLCDEVGMGKTYVAAAIARDYSAVLIVAPAGLSAMWKTALDTTRVTADLVSFEKLSRTSWATGREYDLIVVDEAHHVRNRATHRYRELERLARTARVLLLSATPIHNRRDEMVSLLSLFLGDRARMLTRDELSRCVIRREHHQLQEKALVPEILPVVTLPVSDRVDVVDALMALPPAVAVRDGGLAQTLVGRGLVHQWASSEAALDEGLRKRIARADALAASLAVGTYPTEAELRTWTFADGALQLGFAEFLAAPASGAKPLLLCVTRHRDALQRLLVSMRGDAPLDAQRASLLIGIREKHPGEKIVAFAQYAATVAMLFRKLLRTGGIAMLTARGAMVAGGKMPRQQALARFAPQASGARRPPRGEEIDVLLTTDLLSEGVNLQDAGVIVHLDLPWTAARMEQRVGRLARIGSVRSSIQPYLISPPPSAAKLLESETIIQRKWSVARRAVGSASSPPVPSHHRGQTFRESPAQLLETLREVLEAWRGCAADCSEMVIACVASENSGFVAAIAVHGARKLVVDIDDRVSADIEAQIAACRLAIGPDVEALPGDSTQAVARLGLWFERELASSLAGTASSTLRRKRLLNRIDRAIEDAPPHSRTSRLALATRARRVVASQHSGAVETELEALTHSDLQSEEWLAAVAHLGAEKYCADTEQAGSSQPSPEVGDRGFIVHAILLLRTQSSD